MRPSFRTLYRFWDPVTSLNIVDFGFVDFAGGCLDGFGVVVVVCSFPCITLFHTFQLRKCN